MNAHERALTRLGLDQDQGIAVGPSSFLADFDAEAYSRFKYGDGAVAHQYGCSLFRLLEWNGDISREDTLFVGGSAYYRVPTAAAAIARKLLQTLCDGGYNASLLRIHCAPYGSDYGAMDVAARAEMLADNSVWLEAGTLQQVRGATVIIVDDIRITGLHEQVLASYFERAEVSTAFFCYVAILNQADGMRHPRVEDVLNHAYVQHLGHVLEIARHPDFYPNARLCKFVLKADSQEIGAFGSHVSSAVLGQLLTYMQADGYDAMQQYRPGYLMLDSLSRAN